MFALLCDLWEGIGEIVRIGNLLGLWCIFLIVKWGVSTAFNNAFVPSVGGRVILVATDCYNISYNIAKIVNIQLSYLFYLEIKFLLK